MRLKFSLALSLVLSLVLLATMGVAHANPTETCQAVIQTDDAPRFNTANISIPAACDQFTVILSHQGRLPKAATGHNWVLVTASDVNGVTRDGSKVGATAGYIKPGDSRVIASTPIVGRGESTQITFATQSLVPDLPYVYLSTVDGQSAVMRGTLIKMK